MAYLVRDWWPSGKSYVSWRVDNLKTAYAEYSNVTPPASELSGNLVLVRTVTVAGGAGTSMPGIAESSIWAVPNADPNDLVVEYGIDGHTGAWGLSVAAESEGVEALNKQGAFIEENGELYIGMLSDSNSGILNLAMLEVFPSTRSLPDPYWELTGDDLFLTGANQ
jgi:hypothetical protein